MCAFLGKCNIKIKSATVFNFQFSAPQIPAKRTMTVIVLFNDWGKPKFFTTAIKYSFTFEILYMVKLINQETN